MIGIDTNVLLRFVLADEPAQFEASKAFFARRSMEDPAFISLLVFAEVCWVLRRRYGYDNAIIAQTFRTLLTVEELIFEDEYYVDELVAEEMELNFDISDHVIAHLASRNGCSKTVTFDRQAAKTIPGTEFLT